MHFEKRQVTALWNLLPATSSVSVVDPSLLAEMQTFLLLWTVSACSSATFILQSLSPPTPPHSCFHFIVRLCAYLRSSWTFALNLLITLRIKKLKAFAATTSYLHPGSFLQNNVVSICLSMYLSEPECSSPRSQQSVIERNPEPVKSSSHLHTLFL